ncbi:hypothetical protein [Siccirubricoccus deserti]|uniref:Uncharacterized protein n=1 Tax=Siccirubricoccus deserti TaxID=2013562 RepID=A0A9X0R0C0_9PROT|nr:hypothetical protein [Siccirubricoccus deserti]MBC4017361.1 hypothetical protein [Siccirubricoccus deserti]
MPIPRHAMAEAEPLPHIRDISFRPLAIGSAGRLDDVPGWAQVPAMAEPLPGRGRSAAPSQEGRTDGL